MARGWTYIEERILIENFSTKTIKELLELLPSKTDESINAKIKRLKASGKLKEKKSEEAVQRAYAQRHNEQGS